MQQYGDCCASFWQDATCNYCFWKMSKTDNVYVRGGPNDLTGCMYSMGSVGFWLQQFVEWQ